MSAEYVRNQKLDKFYTVPFVVETCIDRLLKHFHKNEWDTWGTVIEPSAGNGSFIKQIKHRNLISLDISPEHPDIVQQDFLLYEPTELSPVLVIGNPPFGKEMTHRNKFDIIQRFNDLDFSICTDTARQNSLGRADLVLLYTNKEYV